MSKRKERHEGLREVREFLGRGEIGGVIARMAKEIAAAHPALDKLIIVGIRTGGAHIADRLREQIKAQTGVKPGSGIMDITLYRDDVFTGLPRPEIGSTELPAELEGHTVVLVDDVLYTGRTTRAALNQLMDFGRPDCVRLAVLIDRGHRELPIQPDFVGLRVETQRRQSVRVLLEELGEADRVVLFEKAGS